MQKVLFICLGNICRSPTAEAVFKKFVDERKLGDLFKIDSCGTSANHVGESSDHRSIHHASLRGYSMTHKARQLTIDDFKNFDLLVCMDDQNFKNVMVKAPSEADLKKVVKMATYLTRFNDTFIVDPWALESDAFEHVLDLLEDACGNLLDQLTSK